MNGSLASICIQTNTPHYANKLISQSKHIYIALLIAKESEKLSTKCFSYHFTRQHILKAIFENDKINGKMHTAQRITEKMLGLPK